MPKRLFDVIFSFIGLIVLFPLIALIALLIERDSCGPIFYRGLRIGKSAKPFKMYKFRTMVVNADRIGGHSTANDDTRITKVGRILRKYKLDEMPQLINILKGEMSFVGPRPEVLHYVGMFSEEEKKILTVRPGITDWASLWNSDEGAVLAGSPNPEKIYLEKIRPEKIRLQLKYIKERSFGADLKIIFQTAAKLLQR
ncbi:MAG: sugar transferase [Candidatus Omnitrophota bacterium]|nr:sugar transferase [Candidatus Omnitrophota bacterium]